VFRATAGGEVESPAMSGAYNPPIVDISGCEAATGVGAGIIECEESALAVEDRDLLEPNPNHRSGPRPKVPN